METENLNEVIPMKAVRLIDIEERMGDGEWFVELGADDEWALFIMLPIVKAQLRLVSELSRLAPFNFEFRLRRVHLNEAEVKGIVFTKPRVN